MNWLRSLWQRWLNRRIPRSDEYRLGRRNIFVLPSREGMMFAGLLVICLLTGINYQNSLIYLFTFFLGTAFYGTIFQTYRNLDSLHISVVSVGEDVAGQSVPLRLRVSVSDGVARPSLRVLVASAAPVMTSVDESGHQLLSVPVPTRERGRVTVPPVRIETDFPFGLIRAWTWIRPRSQGVATPRPVMPAEAALGADAESQQSNRVTVSEGASADLRLRPYRVGDSMKRISWKRFARTGHMTVVDWDAPPADPRWIDWDQFPGMDSELRLSVLAWLVGDAFRRDRCFGLRLPGSVQEPDAGETHYRRCLRVLGTFGQDQGTTA